MDRGASSKFLVSLLISALLSTGALALSREHLYPYALPGTSSLQVESNGQLVSAEIALKTPIVFYDRTYPSIYVNGNGILSFIRSMQRFFNIAFPLDDPVIAPLYTHVDTRGSGAVYYGETDVKEIVSRASGMVRSSFKDAMDFVPSHVFLATWVDVGYYNEKSDKVNTYQVAISSNGTASYIELLYPEGGIQWIQGESHPSGLPDARAQAGFMTEGRLYTLKGSGNDHIRNIDKWSNVNRPGQWVFKIGPIPDGENIKVPDNIEDSSMQNGATCSTGATSCHSKANCIDYEVGYCCECKTGYFGNGKSCQPNDLPLRVIGRIGGKLNGEDIPPRDLQCYVQTKDGRTYTAISRVSQTIGPSFQLLGTIGGIIGWLFAKPIGATKNGYQLTGGLLNHTAELLFGSTGDRVTIKSTYLGLDVFGQLKMDAEIQGSLPKLSYDAKVDYGDHDELYTKSQAGTIRSHSTRSYKLVGDSGTDYPFTQDQTITYNDCAYDKENSEDDTTRLKFSRGVTTYESTEGIIRFAMNTKIAPLEEEDPCIQGRATCGVHSSCVVDGDDFKCVCNPGFQYLYEEDNTANCVDVNECTAGVHMCSPDAQCVNSEGSHTCHCRAGFSGDGRVCERLQTCDDTRCGSYEECTMVNDLPVCSCLPGFTNTQRGCYPVQGPGEATCDLANNCSPYGICAYDSDRQGHICICHPGYVGDGYTCYPETDSTTGQSEPPKPRCHDGMCWCPRGWEHRNDMCVPAEYSGSTTTDLTVQGTSSTNLPRCTEEFCCPEDYVYDATINDCVSESGSSYETTVSTGACNEVSLCHPYAQCVYITRTGDYECHCNPGYEGDGIDCVKSEVSCLDVDICDPNASCRPVDTGAKCVCDSGYEGDGTICNPIDECRDATECDENERCAYNPTRARYECACNPGFGIVDGQCVVSDCSVNPSQCHVNAQCVKSGGETYKCVCMGGYHGDGMRQCVADNIGCNVLNNCGLNAVCAHNQTSANYACICEPGFYGDGYDCVPYTSCAQDPGICSNDATCVPTSDQHYTCICNEGFIGDGRACRSRPRHDSNFLLVNQGMATHRIPFFPTIVNTGAPINIAYSQMVIGLDVDCLNGKAYSSDITGNRITSMHYNGSNVQTFVNGVSSAEGLSIDWVSRNIFWTDSGKATLEVANMDTKKRKVLASTGLVNPRGIAVHPYRGKIFWSDWNRNAPKLEWSNEDGSGREIYLHGDNVKLPNSLAIDWASDELCWADAGTFTISCTPIDTRQVHVVAKELSYPFGLAISQNHYYWTDWKTQKVEVAAKSTGERHKAINIPPGGSGKLYGIVAVPEFCPRVSNVCQYENGRCHKDQLCLPDGLGGRTCACPDDSKGPCTESRYRDPVS
ncbi:nidogen isoform X2 [Venturia canescens]|uniref:nidogen isoform X2 n=1 Tax=Venturia canescens TaxID=32260 RepID=UPI001C9D1B7C|nr:nidogen isoform X2 [Venturia canescens]